MNCNLCKTPIKWLERGSWIHSATGSAICRQTVAQPSPLSDDYKVDVHTNGPGGAPSVRVVHLPSGLVEVRSNSLDATTSKWEAVMALEPRVAEWLLELRKRYEKEQTFDPGCSSDGSSVGLFQQQKIRFGEFRIGQRVPEDKPFQIVPGASAFTGALDDGYPKSNLWRTLEGQTLQIVESGPSPDNEAKDLTEFMRGVLEDVNYVGPSPEETKLNSFVKQEPGPDNLQSGVVSLDEHRQKVKAVKGTFGWIEKVHDNVGTVDD